MDIASYEPIYPRPSRSYEPRPRPTVHSIANVQSMKPSTCSYSDYIMPELNVHQTSQQTRSKAPRSDPVRNEDVTIRVNSQSDERLVTSTTKGSEKSLTPQGSCSSTRHSPNSDSNYSFSEFFEKDSILSVPPVSNFIHLASSLENDVSSSKELIVASKKIALDDTMTGTSKEPIKTTEPTSARIYLSKEHSRILLTESGNNFLEEVSRNFDIRVRLEWQSIGNMLSVDGLDGNHDKFHAALIAFLNGTEKTSSSFNNISVLRCPSYGSLPKSRPKLIRFIEMGLSRLRLKLGNVNTLYRKVSVGGESKRLQKKTDRARSSLNMILMGQAELRDGKHHLDELRRYLQWLNSSKEKTVGSSLLLKIENHYQYIFSSIKHEDYPDLMRQYKTWFSKQELQIQRDRVISNNSRYKWVNSSLTCRND